MPPTSSEPVLPSAHWATLSSFVVCPYVSSISTNTEQYIRALPLTGAGTAQTCIDTLVHAHDLRNDFLPISAESCLCVHSSVISFHRLRPVLRRTLHSHRPLPAACPRLTQPVFSLLLSTSVACGRGSGVIRSGRWWVFLHGPGLCGTCAFALGLRTLPLGAYVRIWHTSLSVAAPFATLFTKSRGFSRTGWCRYLRFIGSSIR